jgi:hypothetical protein
MFGLNARRVFYILIIAAVIFVGAQYALPVFYSFQFNDFVRQQVKFAGVGRKTTDDVRREVLDKAKEFSIPITSRDIHITRRGPAFTLDLEYSWPIDLRVYKHDLKFHTSETGESFEK